jgi:hypothetical protein
MQALTKQGLLNALESKAHPLVLEHGVKAKQNYPGSRIFKVGTSGTQRTPRSGAEFLAGLETLVPELRRVTGVARKSNRQALQVAATRGKPWRLERARRMVEQRHREAAVASEAQPTTPWRGSDGELLRPPPSARGPAISWVLNARRRAGVEVRNRRAAGPPPAVETLRAVSPLALVRPIDEDAREDRQRRAGAHVPDRRLTPSELQTAVAFLLGRPALCIART